MEKWIKSLLLLIPQCHNGIHFGSLGGGVDTEHEADKGGDAGCEQNGLYGNDCSPLSKDADEIRSANSEYNPKPPSDKGE